MTPVYGTYGNTKADTFEPTYTAWSNIKARCFDTNNKDYCRYGALGITMHPAWRYNYTAFWFAVGMRPGPGYSLDRLDNSLGYVPGNLRWATVREQNRNRKDNLNVVLDPAEGPINLKDAAARVGIKYHTFRWRFLKYGNDLSKLLAKPMTPQEAGRLGPPQWENK